MIGETVSEVWVDGGEHSLWFRTEAGWFCWWGDGDCCSETWFSDIIGLKSLIGQKVRQVIDLKLPDDGQGRSRQDVDQVFGRAIMTDRGTTTVVCRNSSNGYYGGRIREDDSAPDNDARQITSDDWRA